MFIIFGLLISSIVFIGLCYIFEKVNLSIMATFSFACGVMVGSLFLISILLIPLNHTFTKDSIAQFNETKISVENARKQGDVFENVKLQEEIIKQNQWLAGAKYYRSSAWRLWVPKEIENLTSIK